WPIKLSSTMRMARVRHLDWIFGLRGPRCTVRRGVLSRVGGRLGWLNETVIRFLSTLLLLVMIGVTDHARALHRAKHIDQYGHDVWTSQNGLPGQAVYQILQSPDGYLWLRTSAGLVRFDGVRFVLTDPLVAG